MNIGDMKKSRIVVGGANGALMTMERVDGLSTRIGDVERGLLEVNTTLLSIKDRMPPHMEPGLEDILKRLEALRTTLLTYHGEAAAIAQAFEDMPIHRHSTNR